MDLAEKQSYAVDFAPGQARWHILLAPYDLELDLGSSLHISIGRFSVGLLGRMRIITRSNAGLILRAGSFCEISGDALILVGGEHRNQSLLNCTIPGYGKVFRLFMDAENQELSSVADCGPTEIGDNVIISAGVTLLAGAKVGAGCVIGAGTVVTRECEKNGIYAGVPGRRIRDRLTPRLTEIYDALRLADVMAHHIPTFPALVAQLERGEIGISDYLKAVSFLPARPTVHLDASVCDGIPNFTKVTGYSLGGTRITDCRILDQLNGYFSQIGSADSKIVWTPDIFHTLGLY
jgi:hypothetical protein